MIQSSYALCLLILAIISYDTDGFMPSGLSRSSRLSRPLFMSVTVDVEEIKKMRVGAIKKELESYGLSTKSYFEKSELVEALIKARQDGLTPKASTSTSTSTSSSTSSTSTSASTASSSSTQSTSSSSSSSSTSSKSREERLEEEMKACQAMKAGELKRELQERGVSTTSMFEKSEFVKALAEARVDNVTKGSASGSSDEEGYAEYTDVEVLTSDDAGPRKRSQEQEGQQKSSNPFGGAGGGSPFGGGAGGNPFGGGAGGNPFGGAAGGNPFGGGAGGMGGMGNIADLLKNMGMGGGGGAAAGGNPFGGAAGGNPFGGGAGGNPFGGAGGNPFGGGANFAKAQEMMKNPKMRELMAKAQSNPRIMAALQECMSNPAAMAKYQSDPEISKFLKELQNIM